MGQIRQEDRRARQRRFRGGSRALFRLLTGPRPYLVRHASAVLVFLIAGAHASATSEDASHQAPECASCVKSAPTPIDAAAPHACFDTSVGECCASPLAMPVSVQVPGEATAPRSSGFGAWVSKLFDTSDFPRRWNCGTWTPFHGWVHIVSDIAIWGAYMSIPILIIFYVRRRADVPFPSVYLLFAAFILSCGTGHLIEAGIFWWPAYRVSGASKAITAMVSWATVIALIPILPKALALPGLAKVNEQLNHELVLRRRVEVELESRNADLEQYAYAASHDLKSPLRGIGHLAQWIEEDLGEQASDGMRENVKLLRGRVQRLDALLDDMLAYSRAGRVDTEILQVDTGELIQEVIELTDVPPGFQVHTTGELPSLRTARTPLKQVLLNLVSNAINHHDRSEGFVRLSVHEQGQMYEFRVEDDGPGIPAERREKAFQIFQTLRPRDEVEGSGIGLAMVKKLVESQGGEIRVELGPDGRGSLFIFTWPGEGVAREEA